MGGDFQWERVWSRALLSKCINIFCFMKCFWSNSSYSVASNRNTHDKPLPLQNGLNLNLKNSISDSYSKDVFQLSPLFSHTNILSSIMQRLKKINWFIDVYYPYLLLPVLCCVVLCCVVLCCVVLCCVVLCCVVLCSRCTEVPPGHDCNPISPTAGRLPREGGSHGIGEERMQ